VCDKLYKVKRIKLEIDKSKDQDSALKTMRYIRITPIITNEPNHVFYYCKLQLITSPTDLRDSTTHTSRNAFSVERMFIDSTHIYRYEMQLNYKTQIGLFVTFFF
jgi:hypothetical protein